MNRSNILGELARQFGEATGKRGALRKYLGKYNEKREWKSLQPDPKLLETETEPHTRGAILVAAVFRAFLNMYDNRVADLRRIASDGTGILRAGALHPDLVNRLADEAAKAARHILQMCIRALDYTPPVDLTFGEYLRALITADYDLISDDDLHYRVAVIDAFRDWGIRPADVRSWSVESLAWQQPDFKEISNIQKLASALDLEAFKGPIGRQELFFKMAGNRAIVHNWLNANNALFDGGRSLGLALGKNAPGAFAGTGMATLSSRSTRYAPVNVLVLTVSSKTASSLRSCSVAKHSSTPTLRPSSTGNRPDTTRQPMTLCFAAARP